VATMKALPQLVALHYLFTDKGDKTVAHCLDLDLVVVGKNREIAETRLNTVVRAQIAVAYRTGNPDLLFFHAPLEYWDAMETAENLPTTSLEIETPPMVIPVRQKAMLKMPVFRAALAAVAA